MGGGIILIVGLKVKFDGLTAEQKARSDDSWIAGWIWLTENAWPKFPELKPKSIICTSDAAYDCLENKTSEKDRSGIVIITHFSHNPVENLLEKIKEMSK